MIERNGSSPSGELTSSSLRSLAHMRNCVFLLIAALIPGALLAQMSCPANVKAIPLRKLNQNQIVVNVLVNHSGPYDFLLDTGTQVTVIDLGLAADLHLKATGAATLAGMSVQGAAMYARIDSLELGPQAASNQSVLVYDMKKLQGARFAIRGLLGEDFLSRFDVIIDKAHSVLCIDDTGTMLATLKSDHDPRLQSGDGPSRSHGGAGH